MQALHSLSGLLSHYHHCLSFEAQNLCYSINCRNFNARKKKKLAPLKNLICSRFLQLFSHLQMNYSKTFQRSNVDFLEIPELITTMLVPGKHQFFTLFCLFPVKNSAILVCSIRRTTA